MLFSISVRPSQQTSGSPIPQNRILVPCLPASTQTDTVGPSLIEADSLVLASTQAVPCLPVSMQAEVSAPNPGMPVGEADSRASSRQFSLGHPKLRQDSLGPFPTVKKKPFPVKKTGSTKARSLSISRDWSSGKTSSKGSLFTHQLSRPNPILNTQPKASIGESAVDFALNAAKLGKDGTDTTLNFTKIREAVFAILKEITKKNLIMTNYCYQPPIYTSMKKMEIRHETLKGEDRGYFVKGNLFMNQTLLITDTDYTTPFPIKQFRIYDLENTLGVDLLELQLKDFSRPTTKGDNWSIELTDDLETFSNFATIKDPENEGYLILRKTKKIFIQDLPKSTYTALFKENKTNFTESDFVSIPVIETTFSYIPQFLIKNYYQTFLVEAKNQAKFLAAKIDEKSTTPSIIKQIFQDVNKGSLYYAESSVNIGKCNPLFETTFDFNKSSISTNKNQTVAQNQEALELEWAQRHGRVELLKKFTNKDKCELYVEKLNSITWTT